MQEVKRVLEIFGEPLSNGGQEAFVMNVYRNIHREKVQLDFLTPYYCDNEALREEIIEDGGNVFALNLHFNPGEIRLNICGALDAFFKKHRYTIVHIHSGSISVLSIVSLIAKRNGAHKIICHSHCAGLQKNWKYRLVKMLSKPVMMRCPTHYFACSKVAGEWKYPKAVIDGGKMVVVKNGIDLNKFQFSEVVRKEYRKKLNVDGKFVVGHVGRFSYQKNHDFILDIFAQIIKKKDNAVLLLVGDGELMERVKEKAQVLNLALKVIFYGLSNEVPMLLQAMDVFLLPSHYEGLPIVGVEAQAAGLPLVVSDNVSAEIKLTENVDFLSLERGPDEWADNVLRYADFTRKDTGLDMRNNGYDIGSTGRFIENTYLS